MKLFILFVILFSFVLADTCPQDKEVECVTDVNHALDLCDKAAREKGKDQTADFQCVQFLLAVRKDCWPCICQIAKDNSFKIKGCPESIRFQ